ncbi:MAG: hypothetical protein GY870_09945 [archaeon]|nr:hypothetical protein [archaeon]
MRPLSHLEKKNITDLLQNISFHDDLRPENNERYSIINDRIVALTIKKPISIGLRLNIPFEVCSFYSSFIFHPRILNSKVLEMINFLGTNLSHISQNLDFEHYFPITEKKNDLLRLLNDFMPESFTGEGEKQWITRVRVALMNKYNKLFANIESEFLANLVKKLKSIGLKPSWDTPISLKAGIPAQKRNMALFFTNQEENEFLIIEKGFFTFIRDFEINNIILRCTFESYAPLLLELIFKEVDNFFVEDLVLSWIRFSRMSLNPLISVIESEYIHKGEFYTIKTEKLLQEDLNEHAIPIPALAREILKKEELIKLTPNFLVNPPISFDELNAIKQFEESKRLILNGKYSEAAKILTSLLIILNKYRQKIAVVKVLLKLSKIGEILHKFDNSIDYLKNSLEICKSGEIPMEYIIITHEKLGDIYFRNKQFDLAKQHFEIIIKFLKQEHTNYKGNILLIQLKIVDVLLESESFKDANLLLKIIFKETGKNPELLISYYQRKANYFIKKDSISNAVQILKKGCILEDVDKRELAKCHYLLGKLYIYERNLGNRAQVYLLAADKLLEEQETEDLLLKIKIYECLSDAFKKTKDHEGLNFYSDRARHIRKVLQARGLY